MAEVIKKKSRKNIYLVVAMMLALVMSVGFFAYTFTTTSATISIVDAGEMATVEESADQPSWNGLLPDMGAEETEYLLPNGTGALTQCTQYPATGANWDKVAEGSPDDGDTYVYATAPPPHYARDLYTLQDSTGSSGDISAVTVYFRVSGEGAAKASIKTGGEIYNGTEECVDGPEFVNKTYSWAVNPFTNEEWTWSDVDELQAGVALLADNHHDVFCTQVYVAVTYEDTPEISGNVPEGDLFEITPNPEYPGDIGVNIYLLNGGSLVKVYRYLNIMVELEDSVESTYQLLTVDNGVASFKLQCTSSEMRTLSVVGGSYSLISDDPSQWEEGWDETPELYCEITQR